VGALAAMLLVASRADRAPSRRPYVIVPVLAGAAGCVLTAYAQSPLALTVAITISAVGLLSALPVFWAYPTALFSGTAAAAGIALTVLGASLEMAAALVLLLNERRAPVLEAAAG
jgi:hypothetical protein